jgi:hypothetical protein
MSKENYNNDWGHRHDHKKGFQISKRPMPQRIEPSALESAGDDLVWAIEAMIDDPMNIRGWFLVKDAIARYKNIRKNPAL